VIAVSRKPDSSSPFQPCQARAETVAEKPSCRSASKQRRCLVPASGFFKWQKQARGPKLPFYIGPLDEEELFSFAGLWETWHDPEGGIVESCAIITTEANELMRTIHDRMPVILETLPVCEKSTSALKFPFELAGLRRLARPGSLQAAPNRMRTGRRGTGGGVTRNPRDWKN
jgi:putative SOS response-associated peptidase YedK